jgi:hypothetical protein
MAQELEVTKLTLVDSAGRPRAILYCDPGSDFSVHLVFLDKDGVGRLSLNVADGHEAGLTISGPAGVQSTIAAWIDPPNSAIPHGQTNFEMRAANGTIIFTQHG